MQATQPISLKDFFNKLGPVNFSSRSNTLPNNGGSYQSPTPSSGGAPAPFLSPLKPPTNVIAPPANTPVVVPPPKKMPPAAAKPGAPAAPGALDYSKYTNPETGVPFTPAEYADSLAKRASGGAIPAYAGDAVSKGPQTEKELRSTATDLNNNRNDIATGEKDPYNLGSKSGVQYTPAQLSAIEKAYAGIFDPALKDVFDKLDTKQKEDAAALASKNKLAEMAQQHKYDVELKNMEINANDPTSSKNQDKYEQQYRQILLKPLSNRSGGLGLEDAKVNQAIHLKAIFDQYKDSKGNYNIPNVLYNELALGLARLISPTGVVGSEVQQSITQETAKGDFAKALSYVTGTPQNGTTQDVLKVMKDSIDRQGTVAQQNRDQYMNYLQGLVPTGLSPDRTAALEKKLLNSYSPTGGDSLISPDGLQTVNVSDLTPAQIKEAKAAGWK